MAYQVIIQVAPQDASAIVADARNSGGQVIAVERGGTSSRILILFPEKGDALIFQMKTADISESQSRTEV